MPRLPASYRRPPAGTGGRKKWFASFPGGLYQRDHTDPALAAKYYIAARGTVGHINAANRVDYRQTCSVGNGLHVDDTRNSLVALLLTALAWQCVRVLRGRVPWRSLLVSTLAALLLPAAVYTLQRFQVPEQMERPSQTKEALGKIFWPQREYRKALRYEFAREHDRSPDPREAAAIDARVSRDLEEKGAFRVWLATVHYRLLRFYQVSPALSWHGLQRTAYVAGNTVLFLGGLIALIWLTFLRGSEVGDLWLLLTLLLLGLVLLHAATMAEIRHRLVMHPLLAVALAAAGWELYARVRNRG